TSFVRYTTLGRSANAPFERDLRRAAGTVTARGESSDPRPAKNPADLRSSSILRTTLLVLPAQIGFRALEAALPLLYAYWFGRGDETDVYYFAWAVFTFAVSLVFSIHRDSSLVPILAEERVE